MSGWIRLLAVLRPERIAGLIGIAGAPDFTEELLWISGNHGAKPSKIYSAALGHIARWFAQLGGPAPAGVVLPRPTENGGRADHGQAVSVAVPLLAGAAQALLPAAVVRVRHQAKRQTGGHRPQRLRKSWRSWIPGSPL